MSEEDLETELSNRRSSPRLLVDGDASLLIVKHLSWVRCRITDLSMGGCRIETDSALVAGIQARVEVSFSIRGLLFRFNGLTQWTDGKHVVGIRFVDLTSRRRADLMEILGEVAEANAAEERAAKEEAARALGEAEEQARPEFLPALQVSASADQVED